MEFWGVEVKAGQPVKVSPDDGKLVHISQAALGEVKKEKGSESVPLRLKVDDKNFVVGTLSAENIPQITFDLVLEKEFELSHGWKNGSVYFCGYKADNPYDEEREEYGFDDSESEEEELPLGASDNGKIEPKVEKAKQAGGKAIAVKPESSAKPKVTLVEPKKDDESDDDDDSDEDEEEDSDESGDEGLFDGSSDDEDEDSESDDEDEETPKKAEAGKKRANKSATKTPVPTKKAKSATPQKTDGKGVHTATPHPAKKAGKTPANSNSKSKEQTPKSGGQVTCKSCPKTFSSDTALQSHSKAKHGGK